MRLKQHHWPGNIRELRNVLERALMAAKTPIIDAADLDFASSPGGQSPKGLSNLTLKEVERHYIIQVLNEEDGHVDRAAKRLDIPRSTLYQKIKTYGPGLSRF
jgi:transcriptional regulator of acetoin/glycerol metabolism